jgi:hypothetical protein
MPKLYDKPQEYQINLVQSITIHISFIANMHPRHLN